LALHSNMSDETRRLIAHARYHVLQAQRIVDELGRPVFVATRLAALTRWSWLVLSSHFHHPSTIDPCSIPVREIWRHWRRLRICSWEASGTCWRRPRSSPLRRRRFPRVLNLLLRYRHLEWVLDHESEVESKSEMERLWTGCIHRLQASRYITWSDSDGNGPLLIRTVTLPALCDVRQER